MNIQGDREGRGGFSAGRLSFNRGVEDTTRSSASDIGRFFQRFSRRRSDTTPNTGSTPEVLDSGGIGDKPPEVLNTETGEGDEFNRLQQLVRASSDKVISLLSRDMGSSARYALGYIGQALADTEGVEAAHEYVSTQLQRLNLHPKDEFGVWLDLFKKGDNTALPHARRASGLASEELSFVETIGAVEIGGLHSAERLIELVEAGDRESITVARGMAKTAFVLDRADLFGSLYRQGDSESLDLAIEAAKKAKEYTERTGDRNYERTDEALTDMASYAIQQGKVDDALKLMGAIENEDHIIELHVKLYSAGRAESLQPVLNYLQTADKYSTWSLERDLAEAGYAPAQEAVRKRVKKAPERYSIDNSLKDLVALHKVGDTSSAQKVADLIRSSEHPEYYLLYLSRVGLNDEERVLATQLYESDPSKLNAIRLLYTTCDTKAWQSLFDNYIGNNEVDDAAGYIRYLATHAKTLK